MTEAGYFSVQIAVTSLGAGANPGTGISPGAGQVTGLMLLICMGLALLGVLGILAALLERRRSRKTMERLSKMLDEAAKGEFQVERYDESLLSSIESKMADFLSGSYVSQAQIAEERDKIKGLIGDISHQTKTPMANILLYGQLLEEADLTPESRQTLAALQQQTEKLNFLIGALVELSRLETGIITLVPEPHMPEELVEAVYEQVLPKAQEKGVAVRIAGAEADGAGGAGRSDGCSKESHTAIFDMKWTREALYNIVDNAVKYTSPGGTVELAVQRLELFTRIDVKDTGRGIGEEELGLVFGRFYRGKDVQQEDGVGIGLFLAREIVSREGGFIKVKSAVGVGSTFSVYLPME